MDKVRKKQTKTSLSSHLQKFMLSCILLLTVLNSINALFYIHISTDKINHPLPDLKAIFSTNQNIEQKQTKEECPICRVFFVSGKFFDIGLDPFNICVEDNSLENVFAEISYLIIESVFNFNIRPPPAYSF